MRYGARNNEDLYTTEEEGEVGRRARRRRELILMSDGLDVLDVSGGRLLLHGLVGTGVGELVGLGGRKLAGRDLLLEEDVHLAVWEQGRRRSAWAWMARRSSVASG